MECLIEAKTPSLLLHELAHRWSIVSFYCNRRVRFAANSGHAATAPACPFCANNGSDRGYSITSSAVASSVDEMVRPGAIDPVVNRK
jgi:hypothetical protein